MYKINILDVYTIWFYIGQQYKGCFKTLRTYASELVRFITCLFQEKKSHVSAVKRSHVSDYIEFIKKPTPENVTYYLQITQDLQSTQERLGHADVATTMIYLHTLNEKKKNQANKFSLSEMQEK